MAPDDALGHVIATRVFGPDRGAFLRRGLAGLPAKRRHTEAGRAEALRDQTADVAARQDRLIEELETSEQADRTFRDRLRRRFDALEAERIEKRSQLHDLDEAVKSQPDQAIDLLDALPILEQIDITEAPERIQRKLYDALQLQIHYDRPDQARFRLVLTDDTIEALATSAGAAVTPPPVQRAHEHRTPPGTPEIHLFLSILTLLCACRGCSVTREFTLAPVNESSHPRGDVTWPNVRYR